jgi:nucleoside-diphosphate-sugar epimerase
MVYGPLRHSITSVKSLNESNLRIYKLFINSSRDAELPPNGMHVYTDVRDLAHAHILAATLSDALNKRFIVCAGQVSSQDISDLLRGNILELQKRTPKGVDGGNELNLGAYTCSSENAKRVLDISFRSKEDTFVDLARQLLEIEGSEKIG